MPCAGYEFTFVLFMKKQHMITEPQYKVSSIRARSKAKLSAEKVKTHQTSKVKMPRIFLYMQRKSFGTVLEKLKYTLPDCFEDIVKKSTSNAQDETAKKIAKHLQSLPSLRPCIHSNGAFGVEGRLEKLI